jgi:flavorubredoxin
MTTTVTEIGDRIYRLSTYVPEVGPPAGFTFNQFLIDADEPMLFHCGLRRMFPSVAEAAGRIMPLDRLRWISFGHVEADECGAMNQWLAAAPSAAVVHGLTGCGVSLNDLADRPPQPLADDAMLDLGGRRIRYLDTPHVPHGWEAGLIFEEATRTLFCGDLFTHLGNGPPVSRADIVGPACGAEEVFLASALTPTTGSTIRRLADLSPNLLAVMHGSSFEGDGASALTELAAFYDARLEAALQG